MEIIYHAASRVVSNKIHTRNKSMKTIAYIFKITIGNFWFLINRINTDRRAAFLRHPGLLFNIDNAGELADIAGSLCCSQFQQPDWRQARMINWLYATANGSIGGPYMW